MLNQLNSGVRGVSLLWNSGILFWPRVAKTCRPETETDTDTVSAAMAIAVVWVWVWVLDMAWPNARSSSR